MAYASCSVREGKGGCRGKEIPCTRASSVQAATAAGKAQVPPRMRTTKGSLEYITKAFKMTCLSAWMPNQCFRNKGLPGGEGLCLYRRAVVNWKALQLFLMYLCLLKEKNPRCHKLICIYNFSYLKALPELIPNVSWEFPPLLSCAISA